MTTHLLLERYKFIRPLGEGGFAKTYLAEDCHQEGAYCVVKHLTPAKSSPQFLATARRLFRAEADVLQRLGTHERIPALLNAFEAEGEFYLVQEFIDGESLNDIFKRQPNFSEAQIIDLLEEALPILAYIHQEQVIHRDIKPSNLMRRSTDGKLMLIDFGAVKEITTEFHTGSSDQFTVSIGTQGYSAPEQMAGRPRYSSDLYSLGMTMIRGLTGQAPTELPENPQTGELVWEEVAPNLSPGLKIFLQRLTAVSVYQRCASAVTALDELRHLDTLAALPIPEIPETVLELPSHSPRARLWCWYRSAIAPLLLTGLVLLIRQFGGWVPFELLIYDEWVQRQPDLPPDERLLLVEITEADLRSLRQVTPSDAVLSRAIQVLQSHEPRVLGLDLYRDIPQGEGHEELLKSLTADNIVAIRKLGVVPSEAIPAPSAVAPGQVGFNDFPIDQDGVVRRNLLFASDQQADAEVFYSFSLRLALAYLRSQDILPLASDRNSDYLDLNGTSFIPIDKNFGGYQKVDAAGYQLMLQYRAATNEVPRLSLGDVLNGQFTDAMIRDRIVIIGTTAPSAKDLFYTPFSEAADENFLMPGVMLHVHATSQILDAALNERRLPWALPEAIEIGWIVLWAAGGAWLGRTAKRPWLLGFYLLGGGIVLVAVSATVFISQGWLPLVPAIAAFGSAAIAAALSRTYFPSSSPSASKTAVSPTEPFSLFSFRK